MHLQPSRYVTELYCGYVGTAVALLCLQKFYWTDKFSKSDFVPISSTSSKVGPLRPTVVCKIRSYDNEQNKNM